MKKGLILFTKIRMFNKIYKILKNKLTRNKHLIKDICVDNNSISYNNIKIFNLENINSWKRIKTTGCLISYDGNFKINNDLFPLIESWFAINNRTLSPNGYHLDSQKKLINKNLNKEKLIITETLYVLPYYTSVFGHFTGDVLGSILFYLKEIIKNEKLFIYTPSEKWNQFFKENFADKIYILNPKDILEKNIVFRNCYILPRMNVIQNYILSNNIFTSFLNKNLSLSKKIFLTSGRNSRIANIKEVENFLLKKNFKILYPQDESILKLLSTLKYCDTLITEKASTLNNIHLCRSKKYHILSSSTEVVDNDKIFSYSGIYKSFHKGLYEEILCEDSPKDQFVKPYKKCIHVNLKLLDKF